MRLVLPGAAVKSDTGAAGGAVGNAVQPARERSGLADGGGPAGEDEERGLEGVLGEVGPAEDAPTDAPDERAVTAEQDREGIRIAAVGELFEQLGVGQLGGPGQAGERAQVAENRNEVCVGHGTALRGSSTRQSSARSGLHGFRGTRGSRVRVAGGGRKKQSGPPLRRARTTRLTYG